MRTGKFLLLRVRTRSLYYFNLHVRGTPNCPHSRYFACLPNFCPKIVKKYSADFQQVTKKMHFFLHFFSKIFGQFKKKQYFCIRFRPKFGVAPKDESNDLWKDVYYNKIVVQELNRVVIADIHYSLIIIH